MKLQEIAFMSDLIKRNYRRRMFWFCLYLFVVLSYCSLLFFIETNNAEKLLSFLIATVIVVPPLLHYMGTDSEPNFPWSIKKRQTKALSQFSKVEFDELICSVPLKEYFSA